MNINPGELNKRIEILKYSKPDKQGFGRELVSVRKCWAKYTRRSSSKDKEKEVADTDISINSIRFLIRYSETEYDTKMKVRYAGKIYDIEDINDIDDKHEYIELYCKVGTS